MWEGASVSNTGNLPFGFWYTAVLQNHGFCVQSLENILTWPMYLFFAFLPLPGALTSLPPPGADARPLVILGCSDPCHSLTFPWKTHRPLSRNIPLCLFSCNLLIYNLIYSFMILVNSLINWWAYFLLKLNVSSGTHIDLGVKCADFKCWLCHINYHLSLNDLFNLLEADLVFSSVWGKDIL